MNFSYVIRNPDIKSPRLVEFVKEASRKHTLSVFLLLSFFVMAAPLLGVAFVASKKEMKRNIPAPCILFKSCSEAGLDGAWL